VAQEKAISYLEGLMRQDDPVSEMGDIFQLAVIEMLRKLVKADPSTKSSLMPMIFVMAKSKSTGRCQRSFSPRRSFSEEGFIRRWPALFEASLKAPEARRISNNRHGTGTGNAN